MAPAFGFDDVTERRIRVVGGGDDVTMAREFPGDGNRLQAAAEVTMGEDNDRNFFAADEARREIERERA
jgi:hypothetical protein